MQFYRFLCSYFFTFFKFSITSITWTFFQEVDFFIEYFPNFVWETTLFQTNRIWSNKYWIDRASYLYKHFLTWNLILHQTHTKWTNINTQIMQIINYSLQFWDLFSSFKHLIFPFLFYANFLFLNQKNWSVQAEAYL